MSYGIHPDTIAGAWARQGDWYHVYIESALKDSYTDPVKPTETSREESEIAWREHWGLDANYKIIKGVR